LEVRGYLSEGHDRPAALLEAAKANPAGPIRAKAATGAGVLALRRGGYPAARALHEESLTIRRELGDRGGVAESLEKLASVAAAFAGRRRAAHL